MEERNTEKAGGGSIAFHGGREKNVFEDTAGPGAIAARARRAGSCCYTFAGLQRNRLGERTLKDVA